METTYYMLGVVFALMMLAPIMSVYNLYHDRQLLALLWFLYLFAASVVLAYKGHLYVLDMAQLIADAFADSLMREIERAVEENRR